MKIFDESGNEITAEDLQSAEEQEQEENSEERIEEESNDDNDEHVNNNNNNEIISDDVIVTIAGEEVAAEDIEQAKAPEWVKDLRRNYRDMQKENRELKEKLNTSQTVIIPKVEPVGAKPTLESCDYDTDKFTTDLESWHERKRKAEDAEKVATADIEKQKEAWQGTLNKYGEAKKELKAKDFDDAEENVKEIFDVTQQGIILQGAENAALVIYALGKNPKKAKELGSLKDLVKFAFAVAKLEANLKLSKGKTPPAPERRVESSGGKGVAVDNALEKLRAEAEKSGNYSKVVAYKRQKRGK